MPTHLPRLQPPASRPNLSAYLAQQILDLIRERDLAPGDRLPTAKALAERFSVATPTLREALRRLQATGVVDIRHGSGIYVRQDRERLMLSNPHSGTLEHYTVLQVLEARALIEPHLADLAARHATADELQTITGVVHDGQQLLAREDERYFQINARFHTAIGRASGNLILAQIVESLAELYSAELHAVDPDRTLEAVRASDHLDHVQVLTAIHARDGEQARRAMLQHLHRVRSRLDRQLLFETNHEVS
ncbi:MAG: FadR family transcriptional regulator [Chloroflexota bacterium]|nr:FadR family transcriptional regulator [Chloroflexota bacterium]